jgi:hypothetical protein
MGFFGRLFRMSDAATASEAARALASQRWGPQRPTKLDRELARRVDELPADERARLLMALEMTKGVAR